MPALAGSLHSPNGYTHTPMWVFLLGAHNGGK